MELILLKSKLYKKKIFLLQIYDNFKISLGYIVLMNFFLEYRIFMN